MGTEENFCQVASSREALQQVPSPVQHYQSKCGVMISQGFKRLPWISHALHQRPHHGCWQPCTIRTRIQWRLPSPTSSCDCTTLLTSSRGSDAGCARTSRDLRGPEIPSSARPLFSRYRRNTTLHLVSEERSRQCSADQGHHCTADFIPPRPNVISYPFGSF